MIGDMGEDGGSQRAKRKWFTLIAFIDVIGKKETPQPIQFDQIHDGMAYVDKFTFIFAELHGELNRAFEALKINVVPSYGQTIGEAVVEAVKGVPYASPLFTVWGSS